MNPLSSFSFGKIIKTLVPGLIATGAPLLALELYYHLSEGSQCAPPTGLWRCFVRDSLIRMVILKDGTSAAAFGAALVPLALVLGFFLNTALWLSVNGPCRRWADRNVHPDLRSAREALEARAREGLGVVLRGRNPGTPPVHLPDFFLPQMNLDQLTFLRESYFSWFEFQLNSAAAVLLAALAYVPTVIVLSQTWSRALHCGVHLALPLGVAAGLIVFLVLAAERNLRRYQEGFIWFLAGTLRLRSSA